MRKRYHTGKICDQCGRPYFRSNRVRIWTSRNPGSRMGWWKEDVKLCMNCFSTSQAERVVRLAHITVVTTSQIRRVK